MIWDVSGKQIISWIYKQRPNCSLIGRCWISKHRLWVNLNVFHPYSYRLRVCQIWGSSTKIKWISSNTTTNFTSYRSQTSFNRIQALLKTYNYLTCLENNSRNSARILSSSFNEELKTEAQGKRPWNYSYDSKKYIGS